MCCILSHLPSPVLPRVPYPNAAAPAQLSLKLENTKKQKKVREIYSTSTNGITKITFGKSITNLCWAAAPPPSSPQNLGHRVC